MCICVWNLKPRVQLKIAAVHRSAPGLIGQRWSVKQPATQEFANTSCHLCGSLVDFRWRRCCCGKKLSPCHVCLVEGAELLEASLSSKAGNPSAPPLSTPPWREGRNLFLGTRTWPTSSNAALMFVTFWVFFPFEIQKATFFPPLLLKNPRSKLLIRHESVISGDPRPLVGSHLARPLGFERHRRVDGHTGNPKEWNLKSSYGQLSLVFFTFRCGWTWLIYSAGLLGASSRLISGMSRSRARVMSQRGFFKYHIFYLKMREVNERRGNALALGRRLRSLDCEKTLPSHNFTSAICILDPQSSGETPSDSFEAPARPF